MPCHKETFSMIVVGTTDTPQHFQWILFIIAVLRSSWGEGIKGRQGIFSHIQVLTTSRQLLSLIFCKRVSTSFSGFDFYLLGRH